MQKIQNLKEEKSNLKMQVLGMEINKKNWQIKKLFENFNLTINPGESILITGASGRGKTTLMNLLVRFYDPNSGNIKIDDQNLKDVKFNFRRHISFCTQTHFFFNDSILNNLRFSNVNKYFEKNPPETNLITTQDCTWEFEAINQEPEKEIIDLCTELNFYDRIQQLEGKFNYQIGEGGNKLSGGERQRLNLIRTFLKDSQIYVVDEPTNFLDSYNKDKVVDKLKALKKQGKTLIVISHNLEFDQIFDKIVCFNKEGGYDIGTPEELNQQNTYYSQMKKNSKNEEILEDV